jgi:rod shape-determining protein MreD
MSRGSYSQRLPVIATIVVALMLSIIPLPDWLRTFRPDWVVLTLIFWAMMLPRTWSVGSAWIVGLFLDVAHGTLLGQHALALSVVVFVTVRMHLLMRVFPAGQLMASVFSLLALYQFILFWVNGVVGIPINAMHYWAPVVSGTIVWPIVNSLLNGARMRVQ